MTATFEKQGSYVRIERRFTESGTDPLADIEFGPRKAVIANPDGSIVWEMDDVEAPTGWGQLATDIIVSKYFRKGGVPQPEGGVGAERSARQVFDRIVKAIRRAGEKQGGYFETPEDADTFEAELTYMLATQKAAFNSPVWFNTGLFESYGIKGSPSGRWAVDTDGSAVEMASDYERPGVSACQPYHSLVLTERGLMPIGRIVEGNLVGLKVHDGTDWTEVKATKVNGVKLVHRVRLVDGREIEATGDHLVCAHIQRRKKAEEWVKVEDLKPGMYMRSYAKAEETAWDTRVADGVSVSKAALAGWLQTDGYVGQPESASSLVVELETINNAEREWVLHALDTVFPDVHRNVIDEETDDPKVDYKRIRLYGEALRPFVEEYGLLTRNPSQVVPVPVLTGTPTEQIAYLRSVFQADGYVSLKERGAMVAVSKCSRKMMQGIQTVLARLGIYAWLNKKEDKRADRHDQWVVGFGMLSERERFADLIGFVGADKEAKLEESLSYDGLSCADVRYVPIESITCVGEQEVYDIQTGTEKYLCGDVLVHNCFIQTVTDDLMDIAEHTKREMRVFKAGGGSGANYSMIRGEGEPLSGGGTSSGLMSFLNIFDTAAGATKSGGTTRRAARMVVLDADHPDILKFIRWKAHEEDKVAALVKAGYDSDFNGDAYRTVGGQNANNSVRVTDQFMRAVERGGKWHTTRRTDGQPADTYEAREIMREIAEAAYRCADPGMQFHDTCNKWNTVPNTDEIRATNPCGEFNFVDNSACNLASLNLLRFLNDDGVFDCGAFEHCVRLLILAQEILVDYASYPTREIAMRSNRLRPLGLGYANLGALLMRLGLPYDSAEGRALAGAITALMAGAAWETSALIASKKGPFLDYAANREATQRVCQMHADAVGDVDREQVVEQNRHVLSRAHMSWDRARAAGVAYGFRNAQLTLLAPTGTIGLLMECDTTGVEPDYSLVKLKKLAGGGMKEIVNQSVAPSLSRLGYDGKQITSIVAFVEEHGTVEGSALRDEHLAVFDCAATGEGKRFIRPLGHVEMMAAVQPFLCGSISKTVNMPESSTVEEIQEVYVESWKQGLKCVALYRDNSKGCQVLNALKERPTVQPEPVAVRPVRQRLPKKRPGGFLQEVIVGGHKVYLRTGEYEDGSLGEIWINLHKAGAPLRAWADMFAIAISLGLQYGVPLQEFVDAFTFARFEPAGQVTGHEHVKTATSIPDYIFRALAVEYLNRVDLAHVHPQKRSAAEAAPALLAPVSHTDSKPGHGNGNGGNGQPPTRAIVATVTEAHVTSVSLRDAQLCPKCHSMTRRSGTCAVCVSCGETTGCS